MPPQIGKMYQPSSYSYGQKKDTKYIFIVTKVDYENLALEVYYITDNEAFKIAFTDNMFDYAFEEL